MDRANQFNSTQNPTPLGMNNNIQNTNNNSKFNRTYNSSINNPDALNTSGGVFASKKYADIRIKLGRKQPVD